jgi:radical SAM-linked protein
MAIDKFRFRFRKSGDLRFLSHHDLMRAVERLLRRAAIPFHSTSGFNPRPRVVFPLSLPLGVVGWREVMELELTEPLDPESTLGSLQKFAPLGLAFLAVRRIPPNLTGQVVEAEYRLPIPPTLRTQVSNRLGEILRSPTLLVERTQPQPRTVDIRPYILELRVGPHSPSREAPTEELYLVMNLRVTPTGSARAQEIIRSLGVADLLETGAIVERTNLVLLDELPNPGQARGIGTRSIENAATHGLPAEWPIPDVAAGRFTKDAP